MPPLPSANWLTETKDVLTSVFAIYGYLGAVCAWIFKLAFGAARDQIKKDALAEKEKLEKEKRALVDEISDLQEKRLNEVVALLRVDLDRATVDCTKLNDQLNQALRRIHLLEEENATLRLQANLRDQRIFQLERELSRRNIPIPAPQEGME